MINRMMNNPGLKKVCLALLTLLWMLAAALPASAVPQIMTEYGDQMGWRQTDVNAMGGTGTALYRGAMSNIFNPAFLVLEENSRFDASLSLDQEHEDRFQPLFDNFNSWVADAGIASNRNHYWQTGFGIASRLGNTDTPLTASLSLVDRYPFQYRFDEELRNPSPYNPQGDEPARDMIIEDRMRKVTGTLRNLSVGVGVGVDERIQIGGAVHYAFGTRTETRSVTDYVDADGDDSYHHVDEFAMNGINFSLGLRGVITERVEVGIAWESQLSATGDLQKTQWEAATDTTVETTESAYYRYPNIYRAGLTFKPQTDPRTVFSIELEYIPWKEMADSQHDGYQNPQNLDAVTDVRIGLEHTFYNNVPLRFGFRHFNSYRDRDASSSVFSAGTGIPFGNGMFSASLELSKITSIQEHQFPYPDEYFGDNFVSDPAARVEDTRFRLGVGYSVNF